MGNKGILPSPENDSYWQVLAVCVGHGVEFLKQRYLKNIQKCKILKMLDFTLYFHSQAVYGYVLNEYQSCM